MRAELLNGGAYSRAAFGGINVTATAGSTGDATEANSAYVDRMDGANGLAMSVKAIITYTTALGAGQSLSFAANLQDATSSGGDAVADFGEALPATVVASSVGGGTVTGVVELDFDLSGAERFIRLQSTPDLSRANTDTAEYSVTFVVYGHQRTPVSNSLV